MIDAGVCPLVVIVGGRSHTARFYGVEAAWAQDAMNLERCIALPCGHDPAEPAPNETGTELSGFFGS